MTFLLCDTGWCVHKSGAQNKWDDNTHTPLGNPTKPHGEFLSLQPMFPSKHLDCLPSLTGGCSEGLDAFIFSSKYADIIFAVGDTF